MTAPAWRCLGDGVSPGEVYRDVRSRSPRWLRVVAVVAGAEAVATCEPVFPVGAEWRPTGGATVSVQVWRLVSERGYSRVGRAA